MTQGEKLGDEMAAFPDPGWPGLTACSSVLTITLSVLIMAKYPDDIQTLLQKEMTRKEFITRLGLALLSVFGVGRFLSYLLRNKPVPDQSSLMTYGSGSYSTRQHTR